MPWDRFLKRYIWDDEKTPYFVGVARMNKAQAGYEILAFAVFLAVLFLVVSLAALSAHAPGGRSYLVSIYAVGVACGAICLVMTKHPSAAQVCATAPIAALLYFFLNGFPPGLDTIDEYVLLAITLAIFRYSLRVVTIVKAYQHLPDAPSADGR